MTTTKSVRRRPTMNLRDRAKLRTAGSPKSPKRAAAHPVADSPDVTFAPLAVPTPAQQRRRARNSLRLVAMLEDEVSLGRRDLNPNSSEDLRAFDLRGRRDVDQTVALYRPDFVDPIHWPKIEGFVRSAVTDMNYATPREARDALVKLSRHVYWCWQNGSYDLDRQVIFRREVIAESIDKGMSSFGKRTRGTYRSRLFAMSDEFLTGPRRQAAVPKIGAGDPSAPYTAAQVTALRTWASQQNSDYRRVQATLLLSLGLGAGLSSREMAAVRCGDIDVDEHGVVVNVRGERSRKVPVLAAWEEPLAVIAKAALRPEQWVLTPGRKVEYDRNFVTGLASRTSNRPFAIGARKLRATWLVHHLAEGTPIKALYVASGVSSPEALFRYVQFVPDMDPLAMRRTLRALGTDLGMAWHQ